MNPEDIDLSAVEEIEALFKPLLTLDDEGLPEAVRDFLLVACRRPLHGGLSVIEVMFRTLHDARFDLEERAKDAESVEENLACLEARAERLALEVIEAVGVPTPDESHDLHDLRRHAEDVLDACRDEITDERWTQRVRAGVPCSGGC